MKEQSSLPSHRFHQKLANSDTTEEADNNVFALVNLKASVRSSAISYKAQPTGHTTSSIIHNHTNLYNMTETNEFLHSTCTYNLHSTCTVIQGTP